MATYSFTTDTFEATEGTSSVPACLQGLYAWACNNSHGDVVSAPLEADVAVNGTFDTDTGWTKGDGWSIANNEVTKEAPSPP